MAIDESKEAYNHVVRVLLDAAIDSPVDLLLCVDNCTSIARLRQLIKIKKPVLRRLSHKFRLNDDQYEDLLAIKSYISWTYNTGHSDITTWTHGSFDMFFDNTFDVNNPIMYDRRKAAASRGRPRHHGCVCNLHSREHNGPLATNGCEEEEAEEDQENSRGRAAPGLTAEWSNCHI